MPDHESARPAGVHLYLDSADRGACEPLLRTGLFAGLTTNPTILQRAGLGVDAIPEVFDWATTAGAPRVFLQAWGEDTGALVARGCELHALGAQVVVKIVMSPPGVAACVELRRREIPVLLTAIYTPAQAMIAAAAEAEFIAPYLGKLTDAGQDGGAVVRTMQQALRETGSSTEILLASIRDPESVVSGAQAGIHHFTMNPSVVEAMYGSELTDIAAAAFDEAIGSGGVVSGSRHSSNRQGEGA